MSCIVSNNKFLEIEEESKKLEDERKNKKELDEIEKQKKYEKEYFLENKDLLKKYSDITNFKKSYDLTMVTFV
jgi:hypothetical protein